MEQQQLKITPNVTEPIAGFSIDNPPFEWCGMMKLTAWSAMYLERVELTPEILAKLLAAAYTKGQNNPPFDKDMRPNWD